MCTRKLPLGIILSLFLFKVTEITAFYKATCLPEKNILDAAEQKNRIKFWKPELKLKFHIDNFHIDNATSVLTLNETKVQFFGYVDFDGNKNESVHLDGRAEFLNVVIEEFQNDSNCELIKPDISIKSSDLPKRLIAGVKQLAEHCVTNLVCQQFDASTYNDYLQDDTSPIAKSWNTRETDYNPQKTINEFVDYSLYVLINKFLTNEFNVVELPEISQSITKGINIMRGEVIAKNGTLEGLTSLKRTDNIILSNENLRFAIEATYELPKARIRFGYYAVRFLGGGVQGAVTADIENLAVKIVAGVDYGVSPCNTCLNRYDLKLKAFDLRLTGFGVINRMLSKFLSWLVKIKLNSWSRDLLVGLVNGIDCELLSLER